MTTVLVIEDDDLLRVQLREGLEEAGYEVSEAHSGRTGLKAFEAAPPDVVVTDIVMDDGEGIESIREIRGKAPDIPIIAISGNPAYLRYSGILGATRTLLKPFPLNILIAAIEGR